MKIKSDIVGLKFKEVTTHVTWRQTSNYGASIGDTNHLYMNDLISEQNVAHPMFAVVLSWPIISKIHKYAEMPYQPQLFENIVHYFEHIEFTRLISPDEEVTIDGEVTAVLPHKAGTLLVSKFTISDKNKEHIQTEWIGGLLRGVVCVDSGSGKENLPNFNRLEEEDIQWERKINITAEQPFIYDGCNNIVFDIHTSPKFAKRVGLPNILVQGTATLGMAITEIVNKESEKDPRKVKSISGRFSDMVFPNQTITVQTVNTIESQTERKVFFRVLNEAGNAAISDGVVVFQNNGKVGC
ncbi:MaoC/PaaZ C-terminal domain-containing protein [Alkalihalobacterium elongatum]|uniref:MaoC/PaaZ C-terminal domain-containing protein n=1 Tax=Alkalihalobacterium elongatum TaxID=2675466 RepID=UPI001C20125E|nr:MaoC/PaaZ C-terminal domain-containing protein [Alkalihalobacterium elongatum]